MTSIAALSGRVRFSITYHPARQQAATALATALGRDADVRLVAADPAIQSTLDTIGRALAADGATCPYEVILCDDVSLSDTFADSLGSLLSSVTPDSIVSLFAPAHSETAALGRVLWADSGPGLYPVVDAYAPCTGLAMCRDTASDASAYLRAQFGLGSWRPDDRLLHEYARKAGLRKLVAVPNLIDHDRYRSLSLLGHDLPGLRRSMLFADDAPGTAPERWRLAAVPDGREVVAPYLHWDGLTEQCVRWTEQNGGRLCGLVDLVHERSGRDLRPAAPAAPDNSAPPDGFDCEWCAEALRRHAAQLGRALRWLDEWSTAAVEVPPTLLASAVFGATRKYHTREETEGAVPDFVSTVRESRGLGFLTNMR